MHIENLSFAYGSKPILHDISFTAPPHQLLGIVGPNGCGKSTLLHLLAGLSKPHSGQISIDSKALHTYKRRQLARKVALLPQNPIAPSAITVEHLIQYGRQPYQSLLRQFSRSDQYILDQVTELMQLRTLLREPVETLSGGQRQRVWLAMVLAQDTPYILLDEPTSALDMGHQHEVLEAIKLCCKRGKTVIMVIHDLAAASRCCHQLLALHRGHKVAMGPPQRIITAPLIKTLFSIDCEIIKGNTGHPSIALSHSASSS